MQLTEPIVETLSAVPNSFHSVRRFGCKALLLANVHRRAFLIRRHGASQFAIRISRGWWVCKGGVHVHLPLLLRWGESPGLREALLSYAALGI